MIDRAEGWGKTLKRTEVGKLVGGACELVAMGYVSRAAEEVCVCVCVKRKEHLANHKSTFHWKPSRSQFVVA